MRKELPKSAANDYLQPCLAKHRLERLLERREAARRGKTGGGSHEIEQEYRSHSFANGDDLQWAKDHRKDSV